MGRCVHIGHINRTDENRQAKPTHQNIIRLAPPIVITEEEIRRALDIIKEAMEELPGLKGEEAREIIPPEEHNVKIVVDN